MSLRIVARCWKDWESRNTPDHDYGDLRSPRSRSLPATAMVVIKCAITNHEQPKNNFHNHSDSQSRVAKASLLNNLISACANKKNSWIAREHAACLPNCCQPCLRWRRCTARDPRAKPSKGMHKSQICLSFSLSLISLISSFIFLFSWCSEPRQSHLKGPNWYLANVEDGPQQNLTLQNIQGQWTEACETSRTSFWTFWINCLLFISIAPSDASLGSCFRKMKFSMKHLQVVAWGESRMHLSWNILPVKSFKNISKLNGILYPAQSMQDFWNILEHNTN